MTRRPFAGRSAALLLAVGVAAISMCQGTPPKHAAFAESPAAANVAVHPLDPLTEAELAAAVRVLKDEGRVTEDTRFPLVTLHEPPKEAVLRFQPGGAMRREAFVVVYDRKENRTFEAVVDLAAGKSLSWTPLPGTQPPVLVEEFEQASAVVRGDARWQKAMTRRGITEFAKVQMDSWAGGSLSLPGREGARLLRVVSYYRGDGVNAYGRPIEGVVAVVDMTAKTVVDVVDREPLPVPVNKNDIFDAASLGPPRGGLKPLSIRQDAGVSFEVNGHEVRWQNWRFRYALHPREGLVLYTVGWQEGERLRPVMYRASLSEMLVPYGDADAGWNWRNAFDQGEYGLGQFANPLRAGEEVPENAVLLSEIHASEAGTPLPRKDTIALYEQDGGVLWRHTDPETLRTVTRRGRQLVMHYMFTVGNYDYGLRWIFHQDGTLEAQVELTGVLQVKGAPDMQCTACRQKPDAAGRVSSRGADRYGTLVSRHVVAPNHQHYFCFRLDLDVDGPRNTVAELNVLSEKAGPENPAGNAFYVEQTLLRTEADGRRDVNAAGHRCWKVFHPNATSELGHYAAYLLEPGPAAATFLLPDAVLRKRAGFAGHPLWVTRHQPREMHAAGDYPNQSAGGDGLAKWCGTDEPIANEDVVLWHVLGVTHIPRVEEWPVMPTARAGFRLVPDGFFTQNPALDVPPAK